MFFLGHSQPRRKMGSPHCDFIDSWGSTAQQLNKNTFHNGRKMDKDQKEQMRKMEQCRPNHGSHVPVWVVDFPVTLERNETCWGGGLLVLSFRDEHWQCLPRCICAWHCSILECVCVCTVNGYHLPSILVWFALGQVGLWLPVTRDVYPNTVFHVNVQLYLCFSSTCTCHLAAGTCCCTAIRPLHGLVVIIQTQHMTCKWYES